jgi:hypothetical protein
MKVWFSDKELSEVLGITRQGVNQKAKRGKWHRRAFSANGGPEYRYHLKDLPEDIQAAYAASLQVPFEALQNQLKPPPKAPVKVTIDGYKGRLKEDTPQKLGTHVPKPSGKSHSYRQKIIDAFSDSGLSAKQFIESYNNNLIASDIKERLGRWGHIGSTAVFYQNWRRRYQQFGLAGLAPQYHDRGKDGATLSQEAKDRIEWLYLDPPISPA